MSIFESDDDSRLISSTKKSFRMILKIPCVRRLWMNTSDKIKLKKI